MKKSLKKRFSMFKFKAFLISVVITALILSACGGSSTDQKGDLLKTVEIGSQVWTLENSEVDKFLNGDLIPKAKTSKQWEEATDKEQPAWCYYDFDSVKGEKYGKLYNWYAVNDSRGLAPAGWHVPTKAEWDILQKNAFNKRKKSMSESISESKSGSSENKIGAEEIGFSALPGGLISRDGYSSEIGQFGYWWSSSEGTVGTNRAWRYNFIFSLGSFGRGQNYKGNGMSVRYIRD